MIIYNNIGNKILEIEVDDNSYRNRAIMGDHSLTLYYSLPEHIEIPVGSYCEFQGETFFGIFDVKNIPGVLICII